MKRKLILLFLLFYAFCSHAQQKKKQIRYLLGQIAANQVYIDYIKKGYDIANKGLTAVRNIRTGDFYLHCDFLASLKTVNPNIKNSTKVAAIIAFQVRIIKETRQALREIRETHQFTEDELDYCQQVINNLLDSCLDTIEALMLLLQNDQLAMKDDERINRIDALYADMQNNYIFSSSFSKEMRLLSVQRVGEQIEIKRSKIINGLK